MQKLYHVDNDTYAEPNSMESDECEWTRFVVHCLCITDIFLVEYIQLTTIFYIFCFLYVFVRTVFNAVPFLHYIFLVVPRGVETGQWGDCSIMSMYPIQW